MKIPSLFHQAFCSAMTSGDCAITSLARFARSSPLSGGDVEIFAFGFGQQVGIFHGVEKGFAKNFKPVRRRPRRRDDGSAEIIGGQDHGNQAAIAFRSLILVHEFASVGVSAMRGSRVCPVCIKIRAKFFFLQV